MKTIKILISSALVLLGQQMSLAQEFFPIGAWFPGLANDQLAQFATRLDQVVTANFNTIHAAIEARNPSTINKKFMVPAHLRGLKVQLYSWHVPPNWRAESKTYWAKTLEAEDADLFTHPIGEQDGDSWHANTARHNPGLLLDTPSTPGSGIWLRYHATDARYGLHVFWLKTDDISGPDQRLATLRVLRHSDGTVLGTPLVVRKSDFRADDTYQGFKVEYSVPRSEWVRYQVDWTGNGNLWVDKIRVHDDHSEEDGLKLFAGEYEWIADTLAAYDGVTGGRPWRFYLDDEPRWGERDESVAYVNEFIKAQSGKSGVVAFNQIHRPHMQHFVDTVQPSEFLVDFYPIYSTIPVSTDANYNTDYNTELQDKLDDHVTYLGDARAVANSAGIPLWAVMQVHNWGTAWREPTPTEIRVQVYLALVHGAKGIYYFQYSSGQDNAGNPVHGLVDASYATTPKWDEVKSLNAMLGELDDTLLALTSDAVFAGNAAPTDFVHSLSDTANYHLGTFTHTEDDSRYLMMVNRRCRSTDSRTVTVTLDANELSGTDYVYRMTDVYNNERVTTSPGDHSFSVSLDPGAGKLYRIDPIQRPSAPQNLTVVKVGDGTVTLRWDNPDNDTIDNWQYQQNGGDNWQGMSGANAYVYDYITNTYEYTVRGLTNGTTYTFEVRAHNAAGWGPASASVTATPRLFTLTATALNESVLLNWTPAPSRGALIDRYAYRYSSGSGDTWTDTSSAWVRDLQANSDLSYTVMELTNDELYTFEMYAYDSAGEVAVASASAIPGTATAAVQVAYGSDSYQAQEGGEAVEVTVRLTGPAREEVSIPVTVTRDAGTEENDYAVDWNGHTANSLSFAAGESAQSFTITANQDADSTDETVTVGLTVDNLPSWLGAGTPTAATVRLLDDDGNRTVSFGSVLYQATEGGSAVEVSVSLSPAPWQTVSIPVQVMGAEAGDYTVPNLADGTVTLSFAAGVSSRSFAITANEDPDSADETVSLTFGTLPAGVVAVGTTQQATVRLLDNDGMVSLSSSSPRVGTQLTAELTDRSGGITNTTWQWQRRSSPTDAWINAAGTSSQPQPSISIYIPQSGDLGDQLQATVEYDDAAGTDQTAASAATEAVQAPPETEYAYRLHTSGTTAPTFTASSSTVPTGWYSSRQTPTSTAPYEWQISRSRPAGGSWSSWGSATVVSKYTERQTAFRLHTSGTTAPSFTASSSTVPTGWYSSQPSATSSNRYVWRISRTRPTGGSWSSWGSATVVKTWTAAKSPYRDGLQRRGPRYASDFHPVALGHPACTVARRIGAKYGLMHPQV